MLILSVPSNRAYEVKPCSTEDGEGSEWVLSVPSNRAYEVKLEQTHVPTREELTFSTLESGLRSETHNKMVLVGHAGNFQYPRIGPTK